MHPSQRPGQRRLRLQFLCGFQSYLDLRRLHELPSNASSARAAKLEPNVLRFASSSTLAKSAQDFAVRHRT